MSRLSKLRLVTSLPHLYKKLEEFGVDHDYKIKEMVKNDTEWFASQKVAESSKLNILDNNVKQSPGFKITIDNVDYRQNVHYMTEGHQNIDKHYVSVNATTNRVPANHLSNEVQDTSINCMENASPVILSRKHKETIMLPLCSVFLSKMFLVLNLGKILSRCTSHTSTPRRPLNQQNLYVIKCCFSSFTECYNNSLLCLHHEKNSRPQHATRLYQ